MENWLDDYSFAADGTNSCPVRSTCISFEERYGDARGLCNRMWGSAFFYSEDENNCTVMAFTGENPNFRLTFPADLGSVVLGSYHLVSLGVLLSVSLRVFRFPV